jgi:hypothetical protein
VDRLPEVRDEGVEVEGRAEGEEHGRAEGVEQGRAEGVEQDAEETAEPTSGPAATAGRMPYSANIPLRGGSCSLITPPFLLTRRSLRKSTCRSKCAKKSLPMSAKATAANKNRQVKVLPAAVTVTVRQPQHGMAVPSAAVIAGPEVGSDELCGITE